MKKHSCHECKTTLRPGENVCPLCGLGFDGVFHGTAHIEIEQPKRANRNKFQLSHDRDVYEDGGSDED